MNGLFPVVLRLGGRRCLVIGGGPVAYRKVKALVEAGADELVVISPSATTELVMLANEGVLQWLQRAFEASDLNEAFLVFAATDSRSVNEGIARECQRLSILVNVTDEAEEGSFISPSVVRRGDLLLSVTASGASPALSKKVAEELSDRYGPEYEQIAASLRRLREYAIGEVPDARKRKEVLKLAADEAVCSDIRNDHPEEWLDRLLQRLTGGH